MLTDISYTTGRGGILAEALDLTETARNETHGDPSLNLSCFADLLNAYLKWRNVPELDEIDANMVMVLSKIARLCTGDRAHRDHFVDGAAYFAMAGEAATRVYRDEEEEGTTS